MPKKLTFSHWIAIVFVTLFVLLTLAVAVMWIVQDRDGTFLLAQQVPIVSVIVSGYFAKSGVENWQKIKSMPPPNVDDGKDG